MSMENARRQLGVKDKDLVSIKKANESNQLLLVLLGAVIGVVAFVTGYSVSREVGFGYPYDSIGVTSAAGVGRRSAPWVIVLLVAVLAVFAFDLGAFAAHPTYGEGSYYGVVSRKA